MNHNVTSARRLVAARARIPVSIRRFDCLSGVGSPSSASGSFLDWKGLEGRVVEGYSYDFRPNKPVFHLVQREAKPTDRPQAIELARLKAVFFVKRFRQRRKPRRTTRSSITPRHGPRNSGHLS